MPIVASVLILGLYLFLLALIGRLILDMVRNFARSWTPHRAIMVLGWAIYTVTDRPLSLVRRFIKPIPLGNVSLDLSFAVLIFVVWVMIWVVSGLGSGPGL